MSHFDKGAHSQERQTVPNILRETLPRGVEHMSVQKCFEMRGSLLFRSSRGKLAFDEPFSDEASDLRLPMYGPYTRLQ